MSLDTESFRFGFTRTPTQMQCDAHFDALDLSVTGNVPAGDVATFFSIKVRRAIVDMDYFIDIVTE